MRDVILGVDGGGTKTKTVAVDIISGEMIASSVTGSIHTGTMGVKTAADHLETAIRELHLREDDRIVALAVGDPAIDDSTESDDSALLRELAVRGSLPEHTACFCKSDVFMALYGFTKGAPGGLIVSGTGSMGVALTAPYRHGEENDILTVGGWGEPTGDPGSGYDIAVKGIRAAIDAFDGIAPPTLLCREILDGFGVGSPRDLIPVFNGSGTDRSRIAAFAVRVSACALAGDTVATAILTAAGQVLGKYGLALLQGIEKPFRRLGIYGSVLIKNDTVRQAFSDTVRASMPDAVIGIPADPPEYGAACFAADALRIHWKNTGKEGSIHE